MATVASLTATQQGVVDGEAAALKTQLEAIVTLGVLTGHRINSIRDLKTYLEAAVGTGLPTFFVTARKAGDTLREDLTEGPANIVYAENPLELTKDAAMTPLEPTADGDAATWTVSPELPAGLTLDDGDGTLDGTPTAATAGAVYTITATNDGGTATFPMTITVLAA